MLFDIKHKKEMLIKYIKITYIYNFLINNVEYRFLAFSNCLFFLTIFIISFFSKIFFSKIFLYLFFLYLFYFFISFFFFDYFIVYLGILFKNNVKKYPYFWEGIFFPLFYFFYYSQIFWYIFIFINIIQFSFIYIYIYFFWYIIKFLITSNILLLTTETRADMSKNFSYKSYCVPTSNIFFYYKNLLKEQKKIHNFSEEVIFSILYEIELIKNNLYITTIFDKKKNFPFNFFQLYCYTYRTDSMVKPYYLICLIIDDVPLGLNKFINTFNCKSIIDEKF